MLDTDTEHALEHQRRRRAHFMSKNPPDREEAKRCMKRIDELLDRRPPVAGDGEVLGLDQSSWVREQAIAQPGITPSFHGSLEDHDIPDDPAGGGLGLLDRP